MTFNPSTYVFVGNNHEKYGKEKFALFCKQEDLNLEKTLLDLNDRNCVCGTTHPIFHNRNFIFSESNDGHLAVIGNGCLNKYGISKKFVCSVCFSNHINRGYNVCNDCGKCLLHSRKYIGECPCFNFYSWTCNESKTDGKPYYIKFFDKLKVIVKVCNTKENRIIWSKVCAKVDGTFNDVNCLSLETIEYPEYSSKNQCVKEKSKWFRQHLFDIEKQILNEYNLILSECLQQEIKN